jgi:hypothetical protein
MKAKAIGTLVAVLVLLTLVALPVWAGDSKGLDADAARYQAMGAFYQQAAAERGIEASAARYTAMGAFYLAMAGDDALAANPELRAARAWTAQNAQSLGACVQTDEDRLAANPELALVSRLAGC